MTLYEFCKEIHSFTIFSSDIQLVANTKVYGSNHFAVKYKCEDNYHVAIYHDERIDVYSSDCTFDTILESDLRFHTKVLSRIIRTEFDTFGVSMSDINMCEKMFRQLDRLFETSKNSRAIPVRHLSIEEFNEYIKV